MKGIVFTEFVEMVEEQFSPEIADRLITESQLQSGGVYTAVGTYDHEEILAMVSMLSSITGLPVTDLITGFGEHLLYRFTKMYPDFFSNVENCFDFLETIEAHVHVQVKKLYPDAELPNFSIERPDESTLIMTYRSIRPFSALAKGLINGAIRFYGEMISLQVNDLSDGQDNHARFVLIRTLD